MALFDMEKKRTDLVGSLLFLSIYYENFWIKFFIFMMSLYYKSQ